MNLFHVKFTYVFEHTKGKNLAYFSEIANKNSFLTDI